MNNNKPYFYLAHLEEFRIRLLIILLVITILIPVGWQFSQPLIDWLWRMAAPDNAGKMVYTTPMELFFVRLKLSLILSLCLGSPVIAWHSIKFFYPALYSHERYYVGVLSLFSMILFILGAWLAIIVIYPMVLRFSYSMQSNTTIALLSVNSCVELACWLMLGFGICFQLPILTLFLLKIQIVSVASLTRLRPYIVVAIFIFAALFTPPDIVSQLTMAIPTWLLFEISVILGKIIFKTAKPSKIINSSHTNEIK